MDLSGLLPLIRDVAAYQNLLADIRQGEVEGSLSLLRAARSYLVAALAEDVRRPIVLVMARPEQVSGMVEQLRQWLSRPEVVFRFSEPESLPYERIPWSVETVHERLDVLSTLAGWRKRGERSPAALPLAEQPPLVVTSMRALMQRTLPRREFLLGTRTIRVGQRLNLTRTLSLWLDLGYERTSVVEEPGTFSRRGGMIDVFPADAPYPLRIELFGDEVDSMRTFDPATQRSRDRVQMCVICPAAEALPKFGPRAAEKLAALDDSTLHGPAGAELRADLESLGNAQHFKGIEFYIPYLYSSPSTLLDFMPQQGLLIVDDWSELRDAAAELETQALDLRDSLADSGELLRNFAMPYVTWDELNEALQGGRPLALGYDQDADWLEEEEGEGWDAIQERWRASSTVELPLRAHFVSGLRYGGQLKRVMESWVEVQGSGQRVVAVTRQARRISHLWSEQTGPSLPAESVSEPPARGTVTLVQGTLDEGWMLRTLVDAPL